MKPFFITTAIDYTNAPPHIGHAYEKILADVLARYHRLRGREVVFLTGVDQHGQKVQQAAQKAGIAPQEFADQVTGEFLRLWERLGISFDRWAATTDPAHKAVVQKILADLHAAGALYKATHQGHYSVRQEQFLTDKERNADGEFGEEWGEVVFLEEENWYFKLSEQRAWLEDFLGRRKDFVCPGFRQAELANAVAKSSGDLCISRPKARLSWGIEFPFDPEFVTYVWFDALINYVSFAGFGAPDGGGGEPGFDALWPADFHVIGKDILVPAHGVYWPCMLRAMGFGEEQMPTLLVHGWWNLGGAKVSKSLGNVVDPAALCDTHGVAALRYYLMRDISTGRDADFSEERLVMLYNTELANGLGNLCNRTLNMTRRYREGNLAPLPQTPGEETRALLAGNQAALGRYHAAMDAAEVDAALQAAVDIVSAANGYAERMAPWKLAKDPANATMLDEVLRAMAESTRLAAQLFAPVLPDAAGKVLEQIGAPLPENFLGDAHQLEPAAWRIGEPTPVFPRIETAG